MKPQNYETHRRIDPLYHYVFTLLTLLLFLGSIVFFISSIRSDEDILLPILVLIIALCMAVIVVIIRIYPLKAQDRAIRAEENLRHYVLTGRLHDAKLSVGQIAALRFASDAEYVELSHRAVAQNLKPNDIKQSIGQWRADHHRV